MRRAKRAVIACVVTGTALAGCTGTTDPSRATLFDNIANLSGGVYREQEAQNSAEIDRLQGRVASLEGDVAAAEERRAANDAEIARLRREIAAAEAALRNARGGLSDPEDVATAERLQGEINKARNAATAPDANVASIRNRITRINREISVLAG